MTSPGAPVNMSRSEINAIIMNYLVSAGYPEAANLFQSEANLAISEHQDAPAMDDRVKVREYILRGAIQDAMTLLQSQLPGLLDNDSKLRFHLYLQQFVELVRERQCEVALDYAQRNLAPFLKESPSIIDPIERAMALLAFEDPTCSPFADLLDVGHRHQLVGEVNAAVLRAYNHPDQSKLEAFLRYIVWIERELELNHVAFNRDFVLCAGTNDAAGSTSVD